jgi:multidrug efflux pump subunit AcrA (membrane-fusion protein)
MKRSPVIIGAGIVVIVIAWIAISHHRPPRTPPNLAPPVPVAVVREGTVDEAIVLSGRVGPAAGTQTKLSFPEQGLLQRIDVNLGERVLAGQALAQLDTAPFAAAAQQASASAQAASAQLANARVDRWSVKLRVDEAELARQRVLLQAGVVAKSAVQAQEATVASDRAEVQSAQDQISAAQAQATSAAAQASAANYSLDRATLRSPANGTVVGIYAQPGEDVNSSSPVVAIAPDATGVATLDVPVIDVSRITTGDLVRVDAAGRSFNARVGGVAPAVDPATGLAEIGVVGVPGGIPPGTPIDASVVYGYARGLVVPESSLVADPQSGDMLAFVESRGANGDQRFTAREVQIGARDGARVLIVSGLRAGERVAREGAVDLLAPSGGGGD